MSSASERSQAVEDVVHAWTYGSNCLLYEERNGADVTVGGTNGAPRSLTYTEAVQTIHAQLVLVALDADLERLQATGQVCYQTAAGMQRTHPADARSYVRAADLCERAAELVVSVGAADDEAARQRLLAVARHDTTMAIGGVDPTVAERARAALEMALAETEAQAAPEPNAVRYPGPSYDPATGCHRIGFTSTGQPAYWRLNIPGRGLEHGLVCGPPGSGKSNMLRMVMLETALQPGFSLWSADPGGRHLLPEPVERAAERTATDLRGTLALLRELDVLLELRIRRGPVPDPDPATPGVVCVVEDAHLVFGDDLAATRTAERIVVSGGRYGIALVVSTPGAELAHYGGSALLRTGLARTNLFPLGPAGRRMLGELRRAPAPGASA